MKPGRQMGWRSPAAAGLSGQQAECVLGRFLGQLSFAATAQCGVVDEAEVALRQLVKGRLITIAPERF